MRDAEEALSLPSTRKLLIMCGVQWSREIEQLRADVVEAIDDVTAQVKHDIWSALYTDLVKLYKVSSRIKRDSSS